MHVLPWTVEEVTEKDAQVFFKRGINFLHYGSLLLENGYEPRLVKSGAHGLGWCIRFKKFVPAAIRVVKQADGSSKVLRRKSTYAMCPEYPTREEALERCYRDIYAQIHKNKVLFKTKTERRDREKGATERDARADEHDACQNPLDSPDVKCREAQNTFQAAAECDARADERARCQNPLDSPDVKCREAQNTYFQAAAERREQLAQTRSSLRPRQKRKVAAPVNLQPLPKKKTRAELQAERDASRHKAKVDARLQEAQPRLDDAVAQVLLLRAAYAKLEAELEDGEYVGRAADNCRGCPRRNATSPGAVAVAPGQLSSSVPVFVPASVTRPTTISAASQHNEDEIDPNDADSVLASLALASLSGAQLKRLLVQFKTVYFCFTSAVRLWTDHVASLKTLRVGDLFPRPPSTSNILSAACRAREADISSLSKKNSVKERTMREWLNYWNANRSFKRREYGGGGSVS